VSHTETSLIFESASGDGWQRLLGADPEKA
jgi:hypothetical protein